MKRTFTMTVITVVAAMAAASGAYALGFATVVKEKDQEKISRCAWESDPNNFNAVSLKGKPGKRDNIWIRTSGKPFEIDVSLEVKDMSVLYDSRATATGKKIVLNKGNLSFMAGGSPNNNNFLKLTKCEMDVSGSLQFWFWEKYKSAGTSTLFLEDSKMTLTGNIQFTQPAMYLKAVKNKTGAEINLTGASMIKGKGTIIADSILNETPDLHFRLVFNEKDGKIPVISMADASLDGVEIHVNVKGDVKNGTYPILELTGKNAPKGKMRGFYINGKSASLGSPVAANGKDFTIELGSADGKATNDYVLTVK